MTEQAIPAGMKPWAGGDSAPADWDGGPVLLRDGTWHNAMAAKAGHWWSHDDEADDVVAYYDALSLNPQTVTPRADEQFAENAKNSALLPCPFCGGEAKGAGTCSADLGLDGDVEIYSIDCQNDKCTATLMLDTKAQTITAWNTRPTPAVDAAGLREALEKIAFLSTNHGGWFESDPFGAYGELGDIARVALAQDGETGK